MARVAADFARAQPRRLRIIVIEKVDLRPRNSQALDGRDALSIDARFAQIQFNEYAPGFVTISVDVEGRGNRCG
jgi:hypothetical protein